MQYKLTPFPLPIYFLIISPLRWERMRAEAEAVRTLPNKTIKYRFVRGKNRVTPFNASIQDRGCPQGG